MRLTPLFFCLLAAAHAEDALRAPPPDVTAPLPELARHGGARFVDLNEDGHLDVVVSNPQGYGVFLYNAVERKNVQWEVGWTQVLREGKAGDANSLPLLADAAGRDTGARFEKGDLVTADGARVTRVELLRVPGPPPLTPQESLAALVLKPGWQARLVAHEPLVRDPVYFDWDARGRLWVVEMGDYPFAPGEKTKDGQVGQGRVSDLQTGRVKILTDTDGDGVFDKAVVFLDGLKHPTSLGFWKGGVFIAHIPDIFYAEDTDGDGVCDLRETWFSGFTDGNPQHLVNGFCLGLDGWFYCANGDSGGHITCAKSGKQVALGTNDFRFHPVTGAFELEAGRTQYGRWRDEYQNWFGNNNSTWAWHYHLPLRWLERHPERQARALRAVTNEAKTVHPVSPPLRRFNWASATNTLTSGCSPMPWRDGAEHLLLVCEPANNLVHRQVLDMTRFPVTGARHRDDPDSEFLASRDNWFRPCLMREGPDGALYVADMYRLVLEHPEWIPAELAKGLDLRAGEDNGRIYRVSRDAAPARGFAPAMDSDIRWQRDTAQRLLLESGDVKAVPELKKLAQSKDKPAHTRIQALWTAHLLEQGGAEPLLAALKAAHPLARGSAIVAAGGDEIHPDELASWFPAQGQAKAVAEAPKIQNFNADRQKVVTRYLKEAAPLQGDAARGLLVYQKACMACHQMRGQGAELGPDLATVAGKPVEQILEAIFDPNRAVELRNAATQITKKDGSLVLGLIALETPHAVTLRLPGGVELPVPRAEIHEMKTLQTSLMPDGLEAVLSAQDTADLLAAIQGR